jgi:hypothetical protein
MKSIVKRNCLVRNAAMILLLGVALVSCSSHSKKEAKSNTSDSDWSSSGTTEKPIIDANAIRITKANGDAIGSISSGSAYSFMYESHAYVSKVNGGKRKYKGNGEFIEVKYKEGAFKVRTADGKLLWKVKIADDKIKISDNEEMQNPWELKQNDTEKIKVKKNDTELGKLKFDASKKEIEASEGSNGYLIKTDKLSLAYGVLLIDDIPGRDKFIIMTEIIGKGK